MWMQKSGQYESWDWSLKFTIMHLGNWKFVCLGICLQLSTFAQAGLMFAMIALPVDQGNHSNQTITLALFPPYMSIESFFPERKVCV